MAIGRSPEIILYRLRQCLFGAFRGDAGEPGGTGHLYRDPAGNLLDITQFRQYRAGGVGSERRAIGQCPAGTHQHRVGHSAGPGGNNTQPDPGEDISIVTLGYRVDLILPGDRRKRTPGGYQCCPRSS